MGVQSQGAKNLQASDLVDPIALGLRGSEVQCLGFKGLGSRGLGFKGLGFGV